MKCLRFFIFLGFIFFISGCSIDYTLVINDNYFDERISVVVDDSSENINQTLKNYSPLHYSDDIFYEKKIKKSNGKTIVKLHYRYSLEEFRNANSINQGFYNRDIKVDNGIIYLNFSDFSGFAAKVDFDIKIRTDNKVLKNNADKVNGNCYIWHVDSDNKDKLNIEMQIKKGTDKSLFKKYQFIICFVIGIVVIGITFGVYITFKNHKKNNEI